ncbi:hypothetical protein [Acanthopleuribacter pedis]|uniref:Uncharacterized protein n=1 Tax=Acanthopleuribacter pedis TaxID=442870 RepID=A0A8J7QBR2_9BACT|nr:hypothetical protein [Acanthopleuribacter pedis]MBO1321189.1 hypothetical protein [Acanthopleuribacter pedis]
MTNLDNTKGGKFEFDHEEMHWPNVEDDHTPQDILNTDGMYKFSKIKDILGMTTMELTKLSKVAEQKGLDTYEHYGFFKPRGSQYVLKMSKFRETFTKISQFKSIPTNIDPRDLKVIPEGVTDANNILKLKGFFRLNDVCQYSPFKENAEVIKNLVRKEKNQERAMQDNGCWYDSTKREYFVHMDSFGSWFFQEVWMKGF